MDENIKKNTLEVDPTYTLKLFVAGREPNSIHAERIVKEVCDTYFKNNFVFELVDVYKDYQEALNNKIMVVPTLIVESEGNNMKIVGSMRTIENLVKALGL